VNSFLRNRENPAKQAKTHVSLLGIQDSGLPTEEKRREDQIRDTGCEMIDARYQITDGRLPDIRMAGKSKTNCKPVNKKPRGFPRAYVF
jgi:hypothetical protein